MAMTQRGWIVSAVALIVVLAAVTATHVADERDADERVRTSEAAATLRLAEHQQASAERTIELEGQLAACELARHHDACPNTGSTTDDAHVAQASGAAPVHVGEQCRVELDYSDDPLEGCRALVRCGDAWVYGGPGIGVFECTVDARGIVHGEDDHASSDRGDPRLVVDRATHSLVISDERPAWSITLTGDLS